jgi:HSP20 family protein
MDRLFEQGFSRPWNLLSSEFQASFPVDIWETNDAVEIRAALPGYRPEDVDVSMVGDVLTIKATDPESEHEEDLSPTYHRREISHASCSRSLRLPVSVDSDRAEANYEHGMLHLTLPKAEAARPKQIKIGASSTGVLSDGQLVAA